MHADKAAHGDFSARERGSVLAALDDSQRALPRLAQGRSTAEVNQLHAGA